MKRKNFFRKRLPAFVMTLLLLGSTVPAAAAADSQAGEDARSMSTVQTFQASGTTIT